ncbi:MAG TPA: helix-turn-helix domain-containing protein [Candidatus Kapabacteria bacterium]|jgi:excisionase family DNA binding protein
MPTVFPEIALLNAEQAAQYLNLSESFIRKAVGRNGIPFVRIGTRTLFRRSDLDTWVASHIVPTADAVSDQASHIAATLHSRRRV